MDYSNDNKSRITRLPYEMQLGIFREMTDMDSVRSLTLAYPQCKSVFLQNQETITDAVYINRACQIVKQVTRFDSFELAKFGILTVCYEHHPLDARSPWMVNYLANEKMPPDLDPSTLEDKLIDFEELIRDLFRYSEWYSSPFVKLELMFMVLMRLSWRELYDRLSMSKLRQLRKFAKYFAEHATFGDGGSFPNTDLSYNLQFFDDVAMSI